MCAAAGRAALETVHALNVKPSEPLHMQGMWSGLTHLQGVLGNDILIDSRDEKKIFMTRYY